MVDGAGRWSLSDDALTIVEERAPSIQIFQVRLGDPGGSTVRILGPDRMLVRAPGAPGTVFYRCERG